MLKNRILVMTITRMRQVKQRQHQRTAQFATEREKNGTKALKTLQIQTKDISKRNRRKQFW